MKEEYESNRRKSIIKRNDLHIKLSKRTKKGQPIMANTVNHLLSKLIKT